MSISVPDFFLLSLDSWMDLFLSNGPGLPMLSFEPVGLHRDPFRFLEPAPIFYVNDEHDAARSEPSFYAARPYRYRFTRPGSTRSLRKQRRLSPDRQTEASHGERVSLFRGNSPFIGAFSTRAQVHRSGRLRSLSPRQGLSLPREFRGYRTRWTALPPPHPPVSTARLSGSPRCSSRSVWSVPFCDDGITVVCLG